MTYYKLSLTTRDGELLRDWFIGDGEQMDYPFPLEKLAPAALAEAVTQRIEENGQAGLAAEQPLKKV